MGVRRTVWVVAGWTGLALSSAHAQLPIPPVGWSVPAPARALPPVRTPLDAVSLRVRSDPGSGRWRDVGLLIGIVGVGVTALAVSEPDPLTCGPCDRDDVPFFDRWAITRAHPAWDAVSTATLAVLGGTAGIDLSRRSADSPFDELKTHAASVGLAFAATRLLKRLGSRRRPYVYAERLSDIDSGRLADAKTSWPSGHTALASALVTSYWLGAGREASPVVKAAVGGTALVTALLRVPAGRHFPSDVLSGAALGAGSALLVHTITF